MRNQTIKIMPDGWYPHPSGQPGVECWWQGGQWTLSTRPCATPQRNMLAGVVAVATFAGMLITFLTPVSLLTGMGMVVFGAVLALGVALLSGILRAPAFVIAACYAMALLAAIACIYDYSQLQHAGQLLHDMVGS